MSKFPFIFREITLLTSWCFLMQQNYKTIGTESEYILTRFGSYFETLHDVSASHLEVLVKNFKYTIQSESKCIHYNMNIGSNNTL